jgi:DNA-binding transcriptional LysR family regulator
MRSITLINRADISGIKLFQIWAFVAVAEHKRFSEAALQLGLTQSAISHAIASLEAELGVQLLSRGRQGAMLTPIGEQVLDDAQQMLRSLEAMAHKARTARGLQGGQVRLASLRSLATYVLPSLIATFQQQFPAIKITLTQYFYNADIQAALQNGAADIAFLELPLPQNWETCELLVDEYIVLLPSGAAAQSALTWEQLSRYPILMPDAAYEGSQRLQQHLDRHAPRLNIAYEINEDSIQVAMVQQGLGAAILPHLAAMPIPSEMRVASLPVPLRRSLGAAIDRDRLQTPATFAFWNLLTPAP